MSYTCACVYALIQCQKWQSILEYKNHCCAANTAFYDTYITITCYIDTTTYDNAVI